MATRITIIGAGPGGYVAAVRAAQLGAEVTVIERETVGGTCLNWGCIPSKIMIRTAAVLEDFHRAATFGIQVDTLPRVDMARLMARKSEILATQAKGILDLLKHHKIRHIPGDAHVKEPGLATVRRTEEADIDVAWDRLIIATGTEPLNIPALPFDGERILSSNHALSLTAVPESILIVGGGVIGCEFACMLSGLGAKVTVVEAMPRLLPLPSVDEACSKTLQREMKKKKIAFMVDKTVTGYEKTDSGLRVTIGPSPFLESPAEKDRKPISAEVEKMLVCIGRKPNSGAIGLENIGVRTDDRGWIIADDAMRTSAPNVFAIGDILGPAKVMLAHVASTEGEIAAENAMGGEKRMHYPLVPGAIFTTPEVADVGLTEAQARADGLPVRADSVLFRTLGKAQVMGEISGQAKIVSNADTGRVLGVHIIGPHATDLIAEATLAIKMGATVGDIADTIHAHPTLAEILLETALKAAGRPVHG
ncbi:dihydrolipoyl dehydrogenase [Desulfococcus sp.]|uniref:dihydrolipoyl dehydrogenase n=1 Tax=Desulfococcus sp. TaxID=2025834 RepID=UPI0035944EDB